ncbi:fluoride efflux transporter CrcB [Agriterribacter sp.]|uniref:fluoride efflux transporter CrcB n=1 Tax=Agriterribacter sp. TaxID=2821509 RepID=UPI002C2C9953|nr:fluoride efflux transporter CrcB [Agriterribacter sp.]HRO45293.1 fluoride efflux transporter CrcB [Agriterribacter sp.]HRQ17146.1 fluoride efflux transporter CrcB [Agriterribacter sp.]
MLKQLLFIGIGGGIGSILRYTVQWCMSRHTSMVFPAGTFIVNITGCFLIGLFYALAAKDNILNIEWRLFLITGLCGGYTTFSSFSYENLVLLKQGHYLQFSLYAGLSVLLGLLATVGGMAAGK